MDSKGFRKEVEKRKEVFKDFERGVLEDIVNGMVNNAGEVARTAAKELLESEIPPPPHTHKRALDLTASEKAYAKAASITEEEAVVQLAEAEIEKERVTRLLNNEFLNEYGEED